MGLVKSSLKICEEAWLAMVFATVSLLWHILVLGPGNGWCSDALPGGRWAGKSGWDLIQSMFCSKTQKRRKVEHEPGFLELCHIGINSDVLRCFLTTVNKLWLLKSHRILRKVQFCSGVRFAMNYWIDSTCNKLSICVELYGCSHFLLFVPQCMCESFVWSLFRKHGRIVQMYAQISKMHHSYWGCVCLL